MDEQVVSRPTSVEAREYYHGLPSKPRLVARTSTTIWPPPRPPTLLEDHYSSPAIWIPGSLVKRLGPIGQGRAGRWGTQLASNDLAHEPHHPLVLLWSTVLRGDLVAALATSPLHAVWSALLPVRVTAQWRNGDPHHSIPNTISNVVLFVTVRPDTSTSWEMAMSAAQACRHVLRTHGVMEVEVEVLEAAVLPLADDGTARPSTPVSAPAPISALAPISVPAPALAGPAVLHQNLDSLVEDLSGNYFQFLVIDAMAPFLSRPGRLLERVEAGPGGSWVPAGTGTLGLYVELEGAPGEKTRIFALTSRHVALGHTVPPNQTWIATSAAAAIEAPRVRWGTQRALLDAVRDFGCYAEELRTRAYHAISHQDHDEVKVNQAVRDLKFADTYIPHVKQAMSDIAAASNGAIRDIGHVAYSAQQCHDAQNGWSDWALIQLNEASAAAVGQRSAPNCVFIGLGKMMDFNRILRSHEPTLSGFPAPIGVDGLNLYYRPPTSPGSGALPQLVMKRGGKTNIRFGVLGEVEAVVRRPLGDGQFRVALAQIVFDFKGDLDVEDVVGALGPFSRQGDSGSAVFDSTGGVIGIVDGGISSDNPEEVAAHVAGHGAAAAVAVSHLLALQSTPRLDVTFVTPIDWIFQEVQAVTGKVPRIL